MCEQVWWVNTREILELNVIGLGIAHAYYSACHDNIHVSEYSIDDQA